MRQDSTIQVDVNSLADDISSLHIALVLCLIVHLNHKPRAHLSSIISANKVSGGS